ncbi:MAG: universal stress protein [Myxococcota bacterium]
MLKNILVAIDFSEESRLALEQAVLLAEHRGSKLVLLWVENSTVSAPTGAAISGSNMHNVQRLITEQHAQAAQRLEALAQDGRDRGVEIAVRVASGHPDEVIVSIGEELGADLIVTGTKGLTGVKRFFLGSVAEKVMRTSTTNVLIVRGQARPLRHVLVPTDFSPASEKALKLAAGLAGCGVASGDAGSPPGQIDLLHAWQYPTGTTGVSTPNPTEGPLAEVRAEILTAGEAQGRKLIARFNLDRCLINFVQDYGSAAAVIQDRIESRINNRPYDLVAMGTHGYRGFRRFLLGSVAEATLRHAPCSVLVTPAEKKG